MEEGQRTMMTTGKSTILFLSSIGVLQGANALARVHFPIRLSRPNSVTKRQSQTQYTFCLATDSDLSNEGEPEDDLKSVEISSVRIDDGGSDLTDRFKYKVTNMGSYRMVKPFFFDRLFNETICAILSVNSYR